VSDRVCLVTGGARGIGRATCVALARDGWDVVVHGRERRDAAEAVAAEVRGLGRRAAVVLGDVAREADVVAMTEAAVRALGRLDGLVGSAGIGLQARCEAYEAAALERLLAVNVTGLMLGCREAVRRMARSRGGSGGAIVAVSSMAATIGGRPGAAAYAASKGAVDVFAQGLAKEVAAEGIRVNVVRPGVTLTDMTAAVRDDPARLAAVAATIPMGRAGQPEEVAEAIAWLMSERASFVTGAHVNVGGGGFVVGQPVEPSPGAAAR
jgi:NAD(P)-dependent dehydrogenase (short-subunit alcohol dehydrogenase family)